MCFIPILHVFCKCDLSLCTRLQITAKCLASNVVGDMTPAAGVLSCIINHSEAARELVFSARPAVLPTLLNALSLGSPSLTAAAIGKHVCGVNLTHFQVAERMLHRLVGKTCMGH